MKKGKMGIRMTIDARERGVRESLEAQCLTMGNTLKNYIESNFRYPDGEKVECALYPHTIGRVKETIECEEYFAENQVVASITVTPCWCYGTETMDMHPTRPKAIWGFNGTERPGAVYLAAVLSAHNQLGLPAFGIYGEDVQDADYVGVPDDVAKKIDLFVSGAITVGALNNTSYLSIGGISMGIAGSDVNSKLFKDYFNMRVESVDMVEILRRIDQGVYDEEEFVKAKEWAKEKCLEGRDNNARDNTFSEEEKAVMWDKVIKMSIIMRDLMVGNDKLKELGYNEESLGHSATMAGFQGQREWTDYQPNGDFAEAILNSSFDWNGQREPYIMATENDALNAVVMAFGKYLTSTAQVFCDVRTYWSPSALARISDKQIAENLKGGVIHLINSGSASLDGTGQQTSGDKPTIKPFWDVTEEEVSKCLEATKWCPANIEYFRGGGFSSCFLTRGGMDLTMTRMVLVDGVGPVLQIIEGHSIDIEEELANTIMERTDVTWPTTWFTPKENTEHSTYDIMNMWGANHCALTNGHVGDLFITLASMLRIPVALHNVEDNRIFRPTYWNMCGTKNLESADFLACKTLGPLYK